MTAGVEAKGMALEKSAATAVSGLEQTAAAAVASQAKAAVEARYLVAFQRPRDWRQVRLQILDACDRPIFAESARYSKPVGGKDIVGPSIRFAEEALRCMGNTLVESMVVYDDSEKRIVRVGVTDLESNLSFPQDLVINKTVERRSLRKGQEPLGTRVNSKGDLVYIVEATEDDLLTKQNAHTSKAIRTGALRLLPADILEEAMTKVADVVKSRDKTDPTAALKKVMDSFYDYAVEPKDLEAYLGHSLEALTESELGKLRNVYNAIKEGETTWAQVMESKTNGAPAAPAKPGVATPSGTEGLKSAVAQKVAESDDEKRVREEDRKLAQGDKK